MTYIRHLLKAYPVSCFYILMIWILCFATIPSTPLDNVTLIDKWVHIAMYGGTCATIWLEYLRLHNTKPQPVMHIASPSDKPLLSWTKLFCLAWIAPILMSGVIEILQEYCTGGRRSGDWLDFAANSIGATVGALFLQIDATRTNTNWMAINTDISHKVLNLSFGKYIKVILS